MEFKFGNALKELRFKYELSQKNLAKGICDQGLVSRIENDDTIPSSYVLIMFARKLGIGVEHFIKLSETSNFHYYDEVKKQAESLLKSKKYEELSIFFKYEKQNPLFSYGQGYRYMLWLEGNCLYYVDRQPNNAINTYKKALELSDTSKKTHSNFDLRVLNSLASLYAQENMCDEAYNIYEDLIDYTNRNNSVDHKILLDILYNFSNVLISLEKYNYAYDLCRKGIKFCERQDSLYLLGNFYFNKGEIEALREEFYSAIHNYQKSITIFTIGKKINYVEIAQEKINKLKSSILEK